MAGELRRGRGIVTYKPPQGVRIVPYNFIQTSDVAVQSWISMSDSSTQIWKGDVTDAWTAEVAIQSAPTMETRGMQTVGLTMVDTPVQCDQTVTLTVGLQASAMVAHAAVQTVENLSTPAPALPLCSEIADVDCVIRQLQQSSSLELPTRCKLLSEVAEIRHQMSLLVERCGTVKDYVRLLLDVGEHRDDTRGPARTTAGSQQSSSRCNLSLDLAEEDIVNDNNLACNHDICVDFPDWDLSQVYISDDDDCFGENLDNVSEPVSLAPSSSDDLKRTRMASCSPPERLLASDSPSSFTTALMQAPIMENLNSRDIPSSSVKNRSSSSHPPGFPDPSATIGVHPNPIPGTQLPNMELSAVNQAVDLALTEDPSLTRKISTMLLERCPVLGMDPSALRLATYRELVILRQMQSNSILVMSTLPKPPPFPEAHSMASNPSPFPDLSSNPPTSKMSALHFSRPQNSASSSTLASAPLNSAISTASSFPKPNRTVSSSDLRYQSTLSPSNRSQLGSGGKASPCRSTPPPVRPSLQPPPVPSYCLSRTSGTSSVWSFPPSPGNTGKNYASAQLQATLLTNSSSDVDSRPGRPTDGGHLGAPQASRASPGVACKSVDSIHAVTTTCDLDQSAVAGRKGVMEVEGDSRWEEDAGKAWSKMHIKKRSGMQLTQYVAPSKSDSVAVSDRWFVNSLRQNRPPKQSMKLITKSKPTTAKSK